MPKRKRTSQSDPQFAIRDRLVQSKKLLQRALKTAKGFERQKLGKRLKNAQTNGTDVSRINREIEALKSLELGEVAEGYLYGRIGKIKRFVESGLLPEEILAGKKEKEGLSEEEVAAVRNVTSGMFNMGCVKVVLEEVLRGLYLDMGIPVPEDVKRKGKKVKKLEEKAPKGILKTQKMAEVVKEDGESAWDGFESGAEEDHEKNGQDEDMDSEDLSRYDGLLGSDSESNSDSSSDEEDGIQRPSAKPSKPTKQLSLSPSPSPSPPPPSKHPKTKPPTAPPKARIALPSLQAGYFSGSDDSSASDIDDPAPPPTRKNRPGQMARRAIWEKKFGAGANHVKSGGPRVSEMGKKGREDSKRGSRGREGGGGRFGTGGRPSRGTGENATEVKKRGMGRKDDSGPLHPSWQAAKAAKEAKKVVAFQGKKVTFD